ncbi:MAG TPA: TetR/AcrR family transcriptional regulator [Dinghuibacter sp.]|jgi:AcrR family transcriptional regulator|uniref:TetR/AcrR family transcriptional regulator n=1 Tax=Dinghuibacter sp. TaxID=2024697 RepID=UPI002D0F130B|nr:TetR/AcrR family transcriptional regulator [Dinghuibacter sp.]HTJ11458.1 TetR/AcrR family transcriptional regulator [Dinghuibacter sp.]
MEPKEPSGRRAADTKERILTTALGLYNQRGVNAVTSRHIAAEMGISAGNLHYHFPRTDDVILALYRRLAAGFDDIVQRAGAGFDDEIPQAGADTIAVFADRSFRLMYNYRFIFLHFVEIARRIPAVQKHYRALNRRRKKEFLDFFGRQAAEGVFRNDLPAGVWEALVTQFFIVGDFWLSNNELTEKLKGEAAIVHYRDLFLQTLVPYLAAPPSR